jgi:hypothetical protein
MSSRAWAMTGGVGLLVLAALAGFGNFVAIEGVKTAADITESEGLFRAGAASLFLVVVLDVIVACALYRVFAPVDRTMSLLAAAFRLVYAAVFMVALGSLLAAVRTLDRVHLDAFDDLWTAGLGLFGVHLLLLGYLVIRSSYVPSWLGILLAIAGLGYFVESLGVFLGQDLTISTYTFVGELLLAFWLVLRGFRPTTPSSAEPVRGAVGTATAPTRR